VLGVFVLVGTVVTRVSALIFALNIATKHIDLVIACAVLTDFLVRVRMTFTPECILACSFAVMASWVLFIGISAVQAHLELRFRFADAILLIFVQIFAVVTLGVITIYAIDVAADWQLFIFTGAVVALLTEFVFTLCVAADQ
jgi:hypothetical protein